VSDPVINIPIDHLTWPYEVFCLTFPTIAKNGNTKNTGKRERGRRGRHATPGDILVISLID